MDLIKDDIRRLYFKYLFSAFGSALICSIYSTVDMICVGQYAGAAGSAALSIIMPLWSIIISLGILIGVGGAVGLGVERGRGDERSAREYFTAATAAALVLTVLVTAALAIWLEPLLRAFGADEQLLPYAMEYAVNIVWAAPAFLIGQTLIAFVRADGAPTLATVSVVTGGVINMILDVTLVFYCDMGLAGAGLATAIGQYVGAALVLTYFARKSCSLRMTRMASPFKRLAQILSVGFSPFIVEISFGITVMLFNMQVMRLSGSDELALFGVLANIQVLVLTLFYAVGQTVQPIASANYGAGQEGRVRYVLTRGLATAAVMGAVFCAVVMLLPRQITALYMDASAQVLDMAPAIFMKHAPAFLFMGIGVVSSYYLQSVLQTGRSLVVSLMRGLVLSAALIYALPALFGFDAIWLCFSITELLTAILAVAFDFCGKKRRLRE